MAAIAIKGRSKDLVGLQWRRQPIRRSEGADSVARNRVGLMLGGTQESRRKIVLCRPIWTVPHSMNGIPKAEVASRTKPPKKGQCEIFFLGRGLGRRGPEMTTEPWIKIKGGPIVGETVGETFSYRF